jgi:hypothetical protein
VSGKDVPNQKTVSKGLKLRSLNSARQRLRSDKAETKDRIDIVYSE